MNGKIECFKAYDVRGIIDETIDTEILKRIGCATVRVMNAKRLVIGHDARESSPTFSEAFVFGAQSEGVEVVDVGLAGTEEVYFATSHFKADVGVVVTASHNPIHYNGLKFVGPGSRPLDVEREFNEIKVQAESVSSVGMKTAETMSVDKAKESKAAFAAKVLEFVDLKISAPLRIVVNCGNGAAGPALQVIIDLLRQEGSNLEIIPIHQEPDHTFPNGIPNPILPQNHYMTSSEVLAHEADFGVAFDGDFDRCFFFDENGDFVPGEIMVGLLAHFFSTQGGAAKIVHDPRLIFNIEHACTNAGSGAIQSKTGHLFMKEAMRANKAIYGGEISAHHYFRDFFFCDSGMIPWLVVSEIIAKSGSSLAEIHQTRRRLFPSSGELNFDVANPQKVISSIENKYKNSARKIDYMDGLSLLFEGWRFSLRASNTEPCIRLNVESLGRQDLLHDSVGRLSRDIKNIGREI